MLLKLKRFTCFYGRNLSDCHFYVEFSYEKWLRVPSNRLHKCSIAFYLIFDIPDKYFLDSIR